MTDLEKFEELFKNVGVGHRVYNLDEGTCISLNDDFAIGSIDIFFTPKGDYESIGSI